MNYEKDFSFNLNVEWLVIRFNYFSKMPPVKTNHKTKSVFKVNKNSTSKNHLIDLKVGMKTNQICKLKLLFCLLF